ncbi:MAG TPA: hypothetical protein VJ486_00620 [Geothrix sp.]|nr:hypothetical protein [Geothrix sp.]
MDPGIERLLEEWRKLDDLLRAAEAARPRWATLMGALHGLLQADPNLFTEELQHELRVPFGSTPRVGAMVGNDPHAESLATSLARSPIITNAPVTVQSKVQMWPLAKRILAEKGPLSLQALHKELVANGWKPELRPGDRRVLYNTLTAMPQRFAKVDGKWTILEPNIFE